jgi:hypothetical protein
MFQRFCPRSCIEAGSCASALCHSSSASARTRDRGVEIPDGLGEPALRQRIVGDALAEHHARARFLRPGLDEAARRAEHRRCERHVEDHRLRQPVERPVVALPAGQREVQRIVEVRLAAVLGHQRAVDDEPLLSLSGLRHPVVLDPVLVAVRRNERKSGTAASQARAGVAPRFTARQ